MEMLALRLRAVVTLKQANKSYILPLMTLGKEDISTYSNRQPAAPYIHERRFTDGGIGAFYGKTRPFTWSESWGSAPNGPGSNAADGRSGSANESTRLPTLPANRTFRPFSPHLLPPGSLH